ncbi:P-loop containing nucleoside triphosphate hydrolase protein [Auriculariales sp. MPI-PUGE-AT-0066]|nr:P-loop containing nucleoside triphosphate hydrolase protein [Auriculariales sp. MPI-PUGE-AT-0066]
MSISAVTARARPSRCLLQLGRSWFSSSSATAAQAKVQHKQGGLDSADVWNGRAQRDRKRQHHQQQRGDQFNDFNRPGHRGGSQGGLLLQPRIKRQQQQKKMGHQRDSVKKPDKKKRGPEMVHELFTEEYLSRTFNASNTSYHPEWINQPHKVMDAYAQNAEVRIQMSSLQVAYQDNVYHRAVISLGGESYCGDAKKPRDAQRLAYISAIYQLAPTGALEAQRPAAVSADSVRLSDGTIVDDLFAQEFVDYYCRKFKSPPPNIELKLNKQSKWHATGSPPWDAVLVIGDKRMGTGTAVNKKTAEQLAYIESVRLLHENDRALWDTYLEERKNGKALGFAPKVSLGMEDETGSLVTGLNRFLFKSALFRNRPSSTATLQLPIRGNKSRARRQEPSEAFLQSKSEDLQARRMAYQRNHQLARIRTQRESLPVFTQAEELLNMVNENDVTVCMAATGSGKTTQIPQLILDDWIAKGEGAKCNILCTQPRRLAAISVANRVADERGETCGQTVGYQVRFDNNLPQLHGSITFCTTGVFLRRMETALEGQQRGPQDMDDITHIIVDEAHERDVDTDLTLMVLKRLLDERRARKVPIKVILMSATIDPTLFQKYFATSAGALAPLVSIPGRSFPVERRFLDEFYPEMETQLSRFSWISADNSVVRYLNSEVGATDRRLTGLSNLPARRITTRSPLEQEPEEMAKRDDELDIPYPLIALTIAHVLKKSEDGHVLVFMPGWDEIMAVQRILEDRNKPVGIDVKDETKYQLLILHSSVPVAEQQKVFEAPKPGVRRIILSTNVAETSVTIPDVVYVVDSARVKELRHEPERHMSSLVSAWVGQSNLNQRAGRAGRHRPGEYYGVLSRKRAEALRAYQTVEMQRVDLSNVVMHVKGLNFPGMEVEEILAATIEPPEPERIKMAIEHLQMVGALDTNKNVTPLGRILLQLPIETSIGRLILYGAFFRCFDRALTLAAILANRDPFMAPLLQKKEAQARKNSWAIPGHRSDPLTVLNVYEAWQRLQNAGHTPAANDFCFRNFLSKPTMLMISKIKGHLLQSCRDIGIVETALGLPMASADQPRRNGEWIPAELNENNESFSLLAGLIAVASQPKFAVRTNDWTFRTQREKMTNMHPSSVNHQSRDTKEAVRLSAMNRDIFAFADKRQNLTTGQERPVMYLMSTTKLEPLTYVLFGAHEVRFAESESALECDSWVAVTGYMPLLREIEKAKSLLHACFLRVYEGIAAGRPRAIGQISQRLPRFSSHEQEEQWEAGWDETVRRGALSAVELNNIVQLGQHLGRLFDSYSLMFRERYERIQSSHTTDWQPQGDSRRQQSQDRSWSSPAFNRSSLDDKSSSRSPQPRRRDIRF